MDEREFLIAELLRFKKEHNRIPGQKDLCASNGYPSFHRYYKVFGSLHIIKETFYTQEYKNKKKTEKRDYLISEIQRYYKENGRVPTQSDFNPNNGYPSYRTVSDCFESWNEALVLSGYETNRNYNRDKEYLINELLRFEEEFGRIPTQRDMGAKNGYPDDSKYYKVFGSFLNALKVASFKNKVKYWDWSPYLTEEFLIKELLRFERENGRLPLPEDMTNQNGYPSSNAYIKFFSSWLNALKEAPFKNRIDEYFFSFENMNLKKWYIVGYFIGDGSIRGNCTSVSTNKKDKDNLIDMYNHMNIQTKISIHKYEQGWHDRYDINVCSTQWKSDLAKYGVVPNKTGHEYIPLDYLKTPEEEAAICRGIFDADGMISYKKTDKYKPKFNVVSAGKQLCENYAYLLKENCDLDINVGRHSGIFHITTSGFERCQKIYDFLYGHDNFHIKRKKERFEKLLNGTFSLENDNY
ncbi:hypothetical protein EQO05_00210 [Methanosarcina sp. MSH10X1]|uniref:homing endonuclease associated repeat-containing protein n=1 Tax=Methanosarcina sp. MSH10X1 TaxID=2507075 RepID=UPI000FFC881B|nr:hypothetical protein [Methanosarcina sp. MSH10X1]RXA21718.1 hypothetical protein EQO05_00210 [Methanosarcina sp. MSH10X1]